jgi:hypothetical protein
MARLQSFAQWLARHAGLVKSLQVSMKPEWSSISTAPGELQWNCKADVDGVPREAHLAAAQELLQLSIHAAGAPLAADSARASAPLPAAAEAAATAAAVAPTVTDETADGRRQQQQQQHQGLCLRSFSSSLPKAVDMLAALQVQHLTRVELNLYRAITDIVANTMERCSLFLPPRWGAGPMALMLWLNLVI